MARQKLLVQMYLNYKFKKMFAVNSKQFLSFWAICLWVQLSWFYWAFHSSHFQGASHMILCIYTNSDQVTVFDDLLTSQCLIALFRAPSLIFPASLFSPKTLSCLARKHQKHSQPCEVLLSFASVERNRLQFPEASCWLGGSSELPAITLIGRLLPLTSRTLICSYR